MAEKCSLDEHGTLTMCAGLEILTRDPKAAIRVNQTFDTKRLQPGWTIVYFPLPGKKKGLVNYCPCCGVKIDEVIAAYQVQHRESSNG